MEFLWLGTLKASSPPLHRVGQLFFATRDITYKVGRSAVCIVGLLSNQKGIPRAGSNTTNEKSFQRQSSQYEPLLGDECCDLPVVVMALCRLSFGGMREGGV